MGTLDERRRDKPTLDETFNLPLGRNIQLFGLKPDVQPSTGQDFMVLVEILILRVFMSRRVGKNRARWQGLRSCKSNLDIEVCSSRYGLCE